MSVPKFGTSGLRGRVVDLTPEFVSTYVAAFLRVVAPKGALWIGQDLRPSSPALAGIVADIAQSMGRDVVQCGALPTPALALAAAKAGEPAIMITGSHIPADRNGLKFYSIAGEITKSDEAAILAALDQSEVDVAQAGQATIDDAALAALAAFEDRYVTAFGARALSGLRIGVWEHSGVARDLLRRLLQALGAETIGLGRSDHFIPVDTEAVGTEELAQLGAWGHEHGLDAIVSTDGDADRPLLIGADGRQVPGDLLGLLTARFIGADHVVVPITANTSLEKSGAFANVARTKIGSPFVLAAMQAAGQGRVVGFEPNGGFLLGFEAHLSAGNLSALMTRDCVLPLVAPLVAAKQAGTDLNGLLQKLPSRFTAADRLQEIPVETSQALIAKLHTTPGAAADLLAPGLSETARDETDGLRVTFSDGSIRSLRPSGNAPELRIYVEAGDRSEAESILSEIKMSVAKAVR